MSRACFQSSRGFDPRYAVCEDYELWLRLTDRQAFGWIPDRLTIKHGGHADQLSKAIPAMDRFRLHALVDCWIRLPERRSLIEQEIRIKVTTLLQGAEKRQLPTDLYQRCLQFLNNPRSQSPAAAATLRRQLLSHMQEDRD